jgi:hypothetical protein
VQYSPDASLAQDGTDMKPLHTLMGVALLFSILALIGVPVSATLQQEDQNAEDIRDYRIPDIIGELVARG